MFASTQWLTNTFISNRRPDAPRSTQRADRTRAAAGWRNGDIIVVILVASNILVQSAKPPIAQIGDFRRDLAIPIRLMSLAMASILLTHGITPDADGERRTGTVAACPPDPKQGVSLTTW